MINRDPPFPTLYLSQRALETNKSIDALVNSLSFPPKLDLIDEHATQCVDVIDNLTGTESVERFLQASFHITESVFSLMGEGTSDPSQLAYDLSRSTARQLCLLP